MKIVKLIADFLAKVFGKSAEKIADGNGTDNVMAVDSGSGIGHTVDNPTMGNIVSEIPESSSHVEASPVGGSSVPDSIVNNEHVEVVIPTRAEMSVVLNDLIEGRLPNSHGKAYKEFRESAGKNRSPEIDSLIKKQGGTLGQSYCQYGCQDMLDELCAYYKVDRTKVNIPEGGGTQDVFSKCHSKYRVDKPDVLRLVTWRHADSWQGHVGMCLSSPNPKKIFKTFEFNTSAGGVGVVRDGDGAAYKDRSLDGFGTMKIRGFIDVYEAIVDAMGEARVAPLA